MPDSDLELLDQITQQQRLDLLAILRENQLLEKGHEYQRGYADGLAHALELINTEPSLAIR